MPATSAANGATGAASPAPPGASSRTATVSPGAPSTTTASAPPARTSSAEKRSGASAEGAVATAKARFDRTGSLLCVENVAAGTSASPSATNARVATTEASGSGTPISRT